MDCPRADSALATCRTHLASTLADPEIDVVLAQHVASVAYSEFEATVRTVISNRSIRHNDPHLDAFVRVAAVRLVRGIKLSDLSGALAWFDPQAKETFNARLSEDPEAAAAWNNILTGRHGLAHEQPTTPSLTFSDLEHDLEPAKRVLDAFRDALASLPNGVGET